MRSLQAIVLICTLCGADTFERQTAHPHGYALDRRSALVGGVSALLTGGATAAEAAPTVPVVFDPMGPQMMAGSKLPDQVGRLPHQLVDHTIRPTRPRQPTPLDGQSFLPPLCRVTTVPQLAHHQSCPPATSERR